MTNPTGDLRAVSCLGANDRQAFGRLPWFALFFLRARRLRALLPSEPPEINSALILPQRLRRSLQSGPRTVIALGLLRRRLRSAGTCHLAAAPQHGAARSGIRFKADGCWTAPYICDMPSMSEIISEHTDLSEADHHWLKLLVSEWQLLADLSFSDLVLWVRDHDPNVFWAAAQIRPFTGIDVAVRRCRRRSHRLLARAPGVRRHSLSGEIVQTSERKLQAGLPVDTHAIPVKLAERVIAVVEQHTSQLGVRAPSSLEKAYLEAASGAGQDDHASEPFRYPATLPHPGLQPAGRRRIHPP